MREIILRLLLLLTAINSKGQVIFTYSCLSKPCIYDYPSDTLEYMCCNDTLCLTLGQSSQACPKLKTTIQIVADTLKIDVVDTAVWQCWESCILKMKYRIWALPQAYYLAKFRGEYYPINCWSNLIKENKTFPPFKLLDFLLTVDIEKPIQINLLDITGRLLVTTPNKSIDLKKTDLRTGIYILQVISQDYIGQRKILIE